MSGYQSNSEETRMREEHVGNASNVRKKWRAGVLGATGLVGQRLVNLLADHPWFELTEVAASERSSGKLYAEAARWHLDAPIPAAARDLVVKGLDPSLDCDFVFSALDSGVAGSAEEDFARAGYPVVSNSKNHRMDPDVPLLIPEVNAAHLDAIPLQQKIRGYNSGFIVTNPNCSTAGLVLVLKPLADAFGLEKIFVVTLQAISGAGYPGVASMDIQGNVVPFISGEEEKMEAEQQKLLGKWDGARFVDAGLGLSAHCNRVPVLEGHLECVSLSLKKIASLGEVREALRQAGRTDLIGNDCGSLIPPTPPREALEARRKDANARFRGDYVHTIDDGKHKKRSRKESRHEPGNSYRPKTKPTSPSAPRHKKKPPSPSADG